MYPYVTRYSPNRIRTLLCILSACMSWFIVMAFALSRRVPSLERDGEFSGIGVVPMSPGRLLTSAVLAPSCLSSKALLAVPPTRASKAHSGVERPRDVSLCEQSSFADG